MLPKTRRHDRRTWLVGALALAGWLTASLTGFASPASPGPADRSRSPAGPSRRDRHAEHDLHVRGHRLGHHRHGAEPGSESASTAPGRTSLRRARTGPAACVFTGRASSRSDRGGTSSARGAAAGPPATTRWSTRRGSWSTRRPRRHHRRRHPPRRRLPRRSRRAAPTPKPTANPRPTPKPTPKPTAKAAAKPTPKPTPPSRRRRPRRHRPRRRRRLRPRPTTPRPIAVVADSPSETPDRAQTTPSRVVASGRRWDVGAAVSGSGDEGTSVRRADVRVARAGGRDVRHLPAGRPAPAAAGRRCGRSPPRSTPSPAPAPVVVEPMTAIVDEDLTPVDDDAPLKEVRKASRRATAAATAARRGQLGPDVRQAAAEGRGAREGRLSARPDQLGARCGAIGRARSARSRRRSRDPRITRRLPARAHPRRHHGLDPRAIQSSEPPPAAPPRRAAGTARACVGTCAPRSRTFRCARSGARSPPSPAPSGGAILGSTYFLGLVLAWMRARAPSQSGSNGLPGSSRSMTSGA